MKRKKVDVSLWGVDRSRIAAEEATTQTLEQPPAAPTPAPPMPATRRTRRALPAPKPLVQKPVDRDAELAKLRKQFGEPTPADDKPPAPVIDNDKVRSEKVQQHVRDAIAAQLADDARASKAAQSQHAAAPAHEPTPSKGGHKHK